MLSPTRPLTIFEAIKKYGWPEPGSEIISTEILLGERCNAQCLFCCAREMNGSKAWLPYAAVRSRLRKAAAAGAWMVTFSGGEATLYPGLERAAAEAKKMGFKSVQLLTNGLRISSLPYARRLAGAGVDEVKISLHGIDAATHDHLTGVKGAFALALKAVGNMNRLGVKVSFNFAVTGANYRQMPLFARFAGTELGLTGFCFMFSFYAGAMLQAGSKLNVSYSAVAPYLKHTLKYIRLKKIQVESKMLSNFPPCVAPEFTNLMSDWGSASPESASKISGGETTTRMPDFYSTRKVKPASCGACLHAATCYGVDLGYLRIYGPGEFRPVTKPAKNFPVSILYP